MGLGTLPTAADGTVIPSTDHNSIKAALAEDFVPRNVSGVATAIGGSLGTALIPWLRAFIGAAGSKISIEESSGNLIFKLNALTVLTIEPANGLLGAGIKDGTITAAKMAPGVLPTIVTQTFNSSGTFNVPATVSEVFVKMISGGGGAAEGGFANGSAGGNGGNFFHGPISVTPSAAITVTIGGGGSGGNAPASSTVGAGTIGGTTSFGALSIPGGQPAVGGTSNIQPGHVFQAGANTGRGGFGIANLTLHPSGFNNGQGVGAFAGGGGGGLSPGGGGGGATIFGAGAPGGVGTASNGANGSANTGGGGGGGSGGANNTGGSGGNGGSGKVIVSWVA